MTVRIGLSNLGLTNPRIIHLQSVGHYGVTENANWK